MSAYYNENDPFAAAWLRELMKAGMIADGEVDERSIVDLAPEDLRGFTQCHFFAGIGGWSYAIRRAGWPDDRPVWTGSCPCQPFSAAGRGQGTADPRHLWPNWFNLITVCRPPVIFGEQVDKALGWLDGVYTDLEAADYAVGAVDLPAGSVGAFHIRQRLWFVAESERLGWRGRGDGDTAGDYGALQATRRSAVGDLADASHANRWTGERGSQAGVRQERERRRRFAGRGVTGELADPNGRLTSNSGIQRGGGYLQQSQDAPTHFWSAHDWLPCLDGKARPVEPGTFPLAHGVPNRVGRLRGYGNTITPQVAEAFIRAYVDG